MDDSCFFEQIGAVGYVVSTPVKLEMETPVSLKQEISGRVEKFRLSLMQRILAATDNHPDSSGITAALVTGKRDGISKDVTAALRDAGLAHLLAISGLHMGMISGILFFSVRYLLVLNQRWALNYPVKKWAAGFAMLGAAAYLVMSGSAWSARRAFIMASIMFFAIIMDRRGLSLRNVAIAATGLLILTPEAILSAGFQMSFAAVTLIIASIEAWQQRQTYQSSGIEKTPFSIAFGKTRKYFMGLSGVSIVAGFATAPFAIYHFNRIANFGLLANMLAMPIVGICVMPLAVLGIVLLPLGLDHFAWQGMAIGLDGVIWSARLTQSLPGSVYVIATPPPIALYATVFAGLWFCLNRTNWRYLAVLILPIVAITMAFAKPVDIHVSGRGRNVAVRLPDTNELVLLSTRREKFAAENWLRRAGVDNTLKSTKRIGAGKDPAGICDKTGCALTLSTGFAISISENPATLDEDCKFAKLILATYYVDKTAFQNCSARILDFDDMKAGSSLSIRFNGKNEIDVKSSDDFRAARPWGQSRSQQKG